MRRKGAGETPAHMRFRMHGRRRGLDGWVSASRRFAPRPPADRDAVRAAPSLTRSNGQTEGRINRLKTIERRMYGRTGLDPLERRFLPAA